MKRWIICSALLGTASHVAAEGQEIDVRAFEYLDVIETSDGSVWKGVVIEQTPNVQYKVAIAGGSIHVIKAADVVRLTKQRNVEYRVGAATPAVAREGGVSQTYEPGPKLPPPMAQSGMRFDPELVIVFPTGFYGDDLKVQTSFAPGVRLGYEQLFGNIGIGGGGHARFTYFRLPGDTKDAAWLLETQLYGRAALHVSRATPYLGMSIGLDTNYIYSNLARESATGIGFGMNLQAGIQIAASNAVAFDLGADYHPATDTISDMTSESVSYFGLRLGAAVRL